MERKNNSNLQELSINNKVVGFPCSECEQKLTEQDYRDKNFTLWFDVDNYDWEDLLNNRAKLTLNIHAITHEKTTFYDCPDVEICGGCEKKFLADQTKTDLKDDKVYLCFPCFDNKWGGYLAERAKRKQTTPEQKEVMRIIQKAVNEHLASNYHKGGHDYSKCSGSDCEGYKLTLESYGYERDQQ